MRRNFLVAFATVLLAVPHYSAAQEQQAPPPATRLEAFQPTEGSIVVIGWDELGKLGDVSVDVRALESDGVRVAGLVVTVSGSERAFVDEDEIPELIAGIDALTAIGENPTEFESFEVRYMTRGGLEITTYVDSRILGLIRYAVQAGRETPRRSYDRDQIGELREIFVAAQQKLASLAER